MSFYKRISKETEERLKHKTDKELEQIITDKDNRNQDPSEEVDYLIWRRQQRQK